ncbi:MAG: LacI family DNA-binding transcriptional regulator [Spirochaetes bacterium]|jgi:DNA-binding LacI/PurR family transcriptional regulator|nr:LacI family DNA-binding transcriptional regulator [Spirochaetota bacterium]
MGEKTVTISDIAQIAGVSKSTVSRALNDSPLISDKVKENIHEIAKNHDFEFNTAARNLSRQKTDTLAFLFPHYEGTDHYTKQPFPMELLRGIIFATSKYGYNLLLSESNFESWKDSHKYVNSKQADGLIIISPDPHDSTIIELVEHGIKFVTWGIPENNGYCTVNSNNLDGGLIATEHLIKTGRKKIGFIGTEEKNFETIMRFLGCDHAAQKHNLNISSSCITYGSDLQSSGYDNMKIILEQEPDIDGVVCCSDLLALGAVEALSDSGRSVPEEVSVVGFGDYPVAQMVSPAITTIKQDIWKAGEQMVENLDHYLKTGEINNSITPVELIIRETA